MMYELELGSDYRVLLNNDQLEQIADVIAGAARLTSEYVGSNLGTGGTNYQECVRPVGPNVSLKVVCRPDEYIEALVFATKVFDDGKRK